MYILPWLRYNPSVMPNSADPFIRYITVSETDKAWETFCTGVGYTNIEPGGQYPFKSHPLCSVENWPKGRVLNVYQLVYITCGQGTFKSENNICESISEGTLFLLFPNVWHWYAPDKETGWEEYWIEFDGAYPQALQRKGFFSPYYPLYHIGLNDYIVKQYKSVIDLVHSQPPGFQQLLGAAIVQILAKLVSLSKQKKQSDRSEEIVQRAKYMLEEHIDSFINIEEIAKQLGVCYSYLRKLFREQTGLSPYQYFLQIKINKAKILLQEGYYSVKEIAFKLGFENQYYFSRLFHRKTGVPPSMWHGDILNPVP